MNQKQVTNITIGVMIGALVVLLAYDVWAGLTAGTNATISWQIWTYSHKWPILPFSVGVLCGHFFFTQTSSSAKP
jgi:hypothetical protein